MVHIKTAGPAKLDANQCQTNEIPSPNQVV